MGLIQLILDENILYTLMFILPTTLGLSALCLVFSFKYTMTAMWCFVTNRPFGFVINSVNQLRYTSLRPEKKGDNEVLTDKKAGATWEVTPYSRLKPPIIGAAYLCSTGIDKTVPPKIAYTTTKLKNLGYSGIDQAVMLVRDMLYTAVPEQKRVDDELRVVERHVTATTMSVLETGGLKDLPATIDIATIYNWTRTNSEPKKTQNIIQGRTIEAEQKAWARLKGLIAPNPLYWIAIFGVVAFTAIIIGYVAMTLLNNADMSRRLAEQAAQQAATVVTNSTTL